MRAPRNWRMVCHGCGHKYPPNSAQKPDCCAKPELHVHNIDRPCIMCIDDTVTHTETMLDRMLALAVEMEAAGYESTPRELREHAQWLLAKGRTQ